MVSERPARACVCLWWFRMNGLAAAAEAAAAVVLEIGACGKTYSKDAKSREGMRGGGALIKDVEAVRELSR